MASNTSAMDAKAIENFQEYLRIPSVHPDVNYKGCVEFFKKQAESMQLPIKIFEVRPNKPIVIVTWEGTEPEKKSILLNGHMDVVPVFPEDWKYSPFSAHMDENGDIYARGSQDCKCVSIQHLEAIRRLKLNGIRLKRTIHVSFVPDEEIGGHQGMGAFTKTDDFQSMNIGFALDEGSASENDEFSLTYGERTLFRIWIHCTGTTGHASLLPNDTAGEKLLFILERFQEFRESEKEKLKNPDVKIGNVTSMNLTMIKGGVQINVIPKEFSVGFDIRLAADVDHVKFEQMIQNWCKDAGNGVYYTTELKEPYVDNTKMDSSNIFWMAFKKASDNLNIKLDPMIRLGASDSRFLRSMGVPTFGFTPINYTPIRMHGDNEFLNKDIFLKGIEIFMNIITEIANV
ncbi:aminoacylase-1-like [Leptopilina heterotoma]|uniref:aminoacylase-1-like n=1 Tax=Leptopilina heterotoma TaxID=63436 RepID=UPI001CA81D71|nr:aminoacylase-1-like [Leptopilina heterotoma]